MSPTSFEQVQTRIAETIVDILWRQWRAIGAAAAGEDARLAVDPEVLLLASLAMRGYEPRLDSAMADWLETGSTLISTQRLKNLAPRFPASGPDAVRRVAEVSYHRGRDHRWRRLAEESAPGADAAEHERSHRLKSAGPALRAPSAFLLRVRTAFGHGIKADLLAVLHGTDFAEEISTLVATLGYQRNPVHLALNDLEASGVVRRVPIPAGTGFTLARPLFPETEVAPWGWWNEILGCLIAVVTLDIPGASASDYAQAVMLRRVIEPRLGDLAHARLFVSGLQVPVDASAGQWLAFIQAVCDRAWWRERTGASAGSPLVPDGPDPGEELRRGG
jgi:hypothetical protein